MSEGQIPRFALTKTEPRRAGKVLHFKFKKARFKDVSISVRRTFKAIGSMEGKSNKKKPKHISQHWVVLFEVQ